MNLLALWFTGWLSAIAVGGLITRRHLKYLSKRIDLVHARIDQHYVQHKHFKPDDAYWQEDHVMFPEYAPKIDLPNRPDLAKLVGLLHSAPWRSEEGDYWELDENDVVHLRAKNGHSKLCMPRSDYEDILKYNEEKVHGTKTD